MSRDRPRGNADRLRRPEDPAGYGNFRTPAPNGCACASNSGGRPRRQVLDVGADVAAPTENLPIVAVHGDASVSHGTIRDGVVAAQVIAYLQADAVSYDVPDDGDASDVHLLPGGLVCRFAPTPPTFRVAEGTPAALIDETVRVVQTINGALPRAWQLPANTSR